MKTHHNNYRFCLLLLTLLLTCNIRAQISFSEILTFENITFAEAQAYLLREAEIINDTKTYTYTPIAKCLPHQIQSDSCTWKCFSPAAWNSKKSSFPLSTIFFEDTLIKNYELDQFSECTFAENYNTQTKGATTFIWLSENQYYDNGNCNNQLESRRRVYSIDVQFADENHWLNFKREVIKNAAFLRTYKYAEDAPIEMIYGITRYKSESGYETGVSIRLYKSTDHPVWHADISFGGILFK